jgi:hypothetical protein
MPRAQGEPEPWFYEQKSQILFGILTLVVGVVGWLITRSISTFDDKLNQVTETIKQLQDTREEDAKERREQSATFTKELTELKARFDSIPDKIKLQLYESGAISAGGAAATAATTAATVAAKDGKR